VTYILKHERKVQDLKKKKKKKDGSFNSEDDDEEDEESELQNRTSVLINDMDDDSDETEWEIFDLDGDCMFCYLCLDADGIDVSVCDTDGCPLAVHLHCCKKKDRELKQNTLLFPGTSMKWNCHYCNGYPGQIPDPIQAFKELIQKNEGIF
jgi:hypothetical protein